MISSFNREFKTSALHCMLPMTSIKRGVWLNLIFDLPQMVRNLKLTLQVSSCFRGETFKSLDSISITGALLVKKLFTMKTRPQDTTGDIPSLDFGIGESIPRAVAFAVGVDFTNQIYQLPSTETKESELLSHRPLVKSKNAKASSIKPVAFGSRSDQVLPPIRKGLKVRPVPPISSIKLVCGCLIFYF
jgi:hypothetical protein